MILSGPKKSRHVRKMDLFDPNIYYVSFHDLYGDQFTFRSHVPAARLYIVGNRSIVVKISRNIPRA
jgi:hypothetical protein